MLQVIFTICIIFILLYLNGIKKYSYWKTKGVKFVKPVPYLGSIKECILRKKSFSDFLVELYRNHPDEKFIGFYEGSNVMLLVRDTELIKSVLINDYHAFYYRGFKKHVDVKEPMMKNIFFMDGDNWKLLRRRLTPVFTSTRIKAMFPLITEKATKLQSIMPKLMKKGAPLDVKDLMARYTIDNVAACGFGIESDAFSDEDSTFRRLGDRIFTVTLRDTLVQTLKLLAPDTFKDIYYLTPEIEHNMRYLLKTVLSERNYKRSGRNDFIDILLELKDMGKMVEESFDKVNPDGSPVMVELEMDESLMMAQVFFFFAGGFETSSSSSSFTLHQLAFHPKEQTKCQQEVDKVLREHENKITYEAVQEMKYLEMCFRESMRLIPTLGHLTRRCTKTYTFPGTDLTVDPGVTVVVSVQGLHTDPNYFPEPDKFIPERFHPDSKDFRKDVYMPFGAGHKICLAERLGVMQSVAGIAALLSKFSVEPAENSVRRPAMAPDSFVIQAAKGGLPLRFVPRKE